MVGPAGSRTTERQPCGTGAPARPTGTAGDGHPGILIAFAIAAPSFRAGDLIKMLGVGSVAIGFAFQNILQNFLAGILLLSVLHALCGGIPDELVQLKPEPDRQAIGENPFGQFAGIQSFPLALGVGRNG
jgi:hypothetical protein